MAMSRGLHSSSNGIRSTLLFIVVLYVLYRFTRRTYKAYCIRSRHHDTPSLPRHPVWGNLVNAGQRLKPSLNRHPDYGFEEIWRDLGEPGCFLVNLAPIEDRGFLTVAEPLYIEAFVNSTEDFKYSFPKSAVYHALAPLIGSQSMISQEGTGWKALRKRFSPGFQPKYIHSLSGSVVSRTKVFVRRLQSAAREDLTFKLADLCTGPHDTHHHSIDNSARFLMRNPMVRSDC